MKTTKILAAAVMAAAVCTTLGTSAVAQEWNCDSTLQSITSSDEHMSALLDLVNAWEGNELEFTKRSARRLFDTGISRERFNNQPESMLDPRRQAAWWDSLPDSSRNNEGFLVTCGAKLTLVGALADQLNTYRNRYTMNNAGKGLSL